jgi:serine/threonine protein kinase
MEFFKVSLDEWFNINYQNPYHKPPLYEGKFLFQLTSGLLHIHAEGFVHGSIKPSNIFVIEYNKDLQIKLSSDFGIIRENHLDKLLSSTPIWLAPELLEGLLRHSSKQITAVQCTKESDTFAAGNAFFYYWSRGQNLFSKNNDRNENKRRKTAPEILTNILNGNHVNLFGKISLLGYIIYFLIVLH